jgi:hypothetical protein
LFRIGVNWKLICFNCSLNIDEKKAYNRLKAVLAESARTNLWLAKHEG